MSPGRDRAVGRDASALERMLSDKEICVCAGAGGVGKTTASAAIAMGMAATGRKVAVLTIDPARRLANSLGLPELGNRERQVDAERFAAAGLEMRGELWAMMLDPKRTFDELVESYAADEATRDRILDNRIYKELSNAVAGSQEYMAMEKLYELHAEERYDLLVLDTPPSRNALDFLDAPERLARFIDSRSLQFFLSPGRSGLKLFGRGTGLLFSALKRVTGIDLLQDLSEFFQAVGDMAEGFNQRAVRVSELLAEPQVTFLLVTSPQRESIEEAVFFHRRLAERSMPFGRVVVNRMHVEGTGDGSRNGRVEDALARVLEPKLAQRVARNFGDYRALAERDRQNVSRLAEELNGEPLLIVPYLEDDVHDIGGLALMNEHLFRRS